jgi:membrane fusion protein, multidrug efflux system
MCNKIIFLIVLAILGSSCSGKKSDSKNSAKGNVISYIEGLVVKPSILAQNISVSGTIKPYEETELMPDLTGRIVAINFQEGAYVKKGTLLIQLYNDDIKAQLHKLKAQLDIAIATEKRQKELVTLNGISKQEYDQTMLSVEVIKADIDILMAQLRKTEILAPFDGVVGLRNISIGAVVTPTTYLVIIRQVDKLKLEFNVPGKYTNDVREGKKISFTVQGSEDKFQAEIVATENGLDNYTRNLKIMAVLNSNYKSLVPGMYANVELPLKENKNAILVPTQAIIPQARNKKVIISNKGKALFKIVKTGVRQESLIEVTEGVKPGDTLVTTGILFIRPDAVLKFSKVIN